ncbi:MAG TPA: M1 family metallopeptidase [Vicinamibacterales bacterium]|nr:M1 family metallopeptidase [Vicinamibacterales bacterium]
MRHTVAAAGCSLLLLFASGALADTYPRQTGVDAQHYVFKLTLSDASPEITGEATVELLVKSDGVREVALDLTSAHDGKGMTVTAVSRDGVPVTYRHTDDRLVLPLAPGSHAGQHVAFTIAYHGVPAPPADAPPPPAGREPNTGLRLIPNKYGEWSAFSENWPNRARQWLPMIDHPYDKATSEFIVTAPSRYQVVANGLLQESLDLGDGRRLTHWRESVPIASWLNALGVEQFAVHYAGRVEGVELETWVAHQDDRAGRVYFEQPARQALEFYSERIGPYAYEKLANVAAAGLSGGTEHASAIFYGETGIRPDRTTGQVMPANGLVYHEVAHQWFGDAVTEKDWDDVWLSEGFATYFALLCTEHYAGHDAFIAGLDASRDRIFRLEQQNPGVAVIHQDLADMSKVLNQIIYQKGGWTLHMLHGLVGDGEFWAGIREYYRRYQNANATTPDLQHVFEDVSGQRLDWFFDQWLRRAGSPSIGGTWAYDAAAHQIDIELDQRQPGDVYRLPLDIGITTGQRTRVEHVEFAERHQVVHLPASAAPSAVVLDPDTRLLFQPAGFSGR